MDNNDCKVDFSRIHGVDSEKGLLISRGNETLYKRLLSVFFENQKNFEKEFCQAIESDNNDLATRLAHTLKGSAGNIGAMLTHYKASDLDQACKTQTGNIMFLFSQTLTELNPLLEGLESFIKGVHEEKIDDNLIIDRVVVSKLLESLGAHLSINSVSADDDIGQLLPLLKHSKYLELLEQVKVASSNYDFESALEKYNLLANTFTHE